MSDEGNTIFVDILSSYSFRPLDVLVKETCKRDTVPIFQYDIGKYLKLWRKVKVGDQVVYSIDQTALCHGKIRYIKSKAFRPLFMPDHQNYQTFVNFASALCAGAFEDKWNEFMIQKHVDAIERRRWFFVTFVVFEPSIIYTSNRSILMEKVRKMEEADERESFGLCPMSD